MTDAEITALLDEWIARTEILDSYQKDIDSLREAARPHREELDRIGESLRPALSDRGAIFHRGRCFHLKYAYRNQPPRVETMKATPLQPLLPPEPGRPS